MGTPHPGKWIPVFETTPPNVPPKVVLNTQKIAVHASVIYKPGLSPYPWKVLYFYAGDREDPNGENKVRSRIWNPNNPGDPPTYQNIPNWPSIGLPADAPFLLCCGHVHMSSSKLIMAGGVRGTAQGNAPHPPEIDIFGLDYTYIFDPGDEINPWKVAGEETGTPHAMADKRFYPTLTQLGVVPANTISGNIVVMSGWKADNTLALQPQYYDEISG